MNTQPSVLGLPTSFDAYIRAGWKLVAIPPGTKGPRTPAWNRKENAIVDSTAIPPGHGVGLAHAYSGTMALDIDDWQQAQGLLAMRGIDLDKLYRAPDAVTIESGREGRGKLIYSMPFGLTLPTKRVNSEAGNVAYELRCATLEGSTAQDVLPPSVHPDTNRPYQWGGNGHWSRLPTIPVELLAVWQELSERDSKRNIRTDTVDASWHDIRAALMHINPSCSREQWVSLGMALHHAATQVNDQEAGIDLWDEWSQQSPDKYKGRKDLEACWRSFRADNSSGITIGTLFHYAGRAGYSRPLPDVTGLFKEVPVEAPPFLPTIGLTPPPPDINLDLFPEVLRRRVLEVSESVGCDPLIPLFAGLGAISAVADARSRLRLMDGYEVPPIIWLMTIGDPAGKKSPGSSPMVKLLEVLEREDYPRYSADLLKWEAADAAHQASRAAYIKASGTPEVALHGTVDYSSLPPVVPAPNWKPAEARLKVVDITSQKLVRLVADRPRGLMCFLDEMASWCQKVTNPNSGEDKSAWTVAYNADYYVMDRVGEKASIPVPNFGVSVVGNIQPQIYQKYVRGMGEDGMLQRFIPCVVREHMSRRNEPIPDMFTNRAEYENVLRRIYATPTLTYTLDSGAYKMFRDFQLWYEQRKQDERLLGANATYMQAFGKLEGTTGRIALLLHLAQTPELPVVTSATMRNAIDLVRTFIVPSYRYALHHTGGMAGDDLTTTLIEWLLQRSDLSEIGIADIRHAVRHRLEDTQSLHQRNGLVRDAMAQIESMGWVTIINDHAIRASWAINPAIKTMYPDRRKAIIEAKKRMRDDWKGNIPPGQVPYKIYGE